MARTWLSIRVELLGGRGDELWPPPGRILAVGPRHTFADLATSIDDAFARWDRAHLCLFALADGRIVTDAETGQERVASPDGAFSTALDLARAKVKDLVGPGDEFSYVFDFGDHWVHQCTVEPDLVDPRDVLGVVPEKPLPAWGWGTIPDQYGRRWDGDSGEEAVPTRPAQRHPMLLHTWPDRPPLPVDVAELRGATHRADVDAILAALEGRDLDPALQHVGTAVWVLLAARHEQAEALALSVIDRLGMRGADGDAVLAEDLLAELRGTLRAVRALPVDLSQVSDVLEGSELEPGGYLDLQTGEVLPDSLTDPAMVGEDEAVDPEEDPDRWVSLDRQGSRPGWRDMAAFAADVRDEQTRARLETAIEGRGAFRRFRDEVDAAGLVDRWRLFSDERTTGRARDHLGDLGISPRPPRRHGS